MTLHTNPMSVLHLCRFDKAGIAQLINLLGIPDEYIMDNQSRVNGSEAFIIFLYRMVYPCRLTSLVPVFGRSNSMLSRIFNHVLNDLYERFNHKLTDIKHTYVDLATLSTIVGNKAPLKNCIGFIDGTVRPICRPGVNQEVSFNGHKRVHAIKFQSVIFSDGIIACMHGPYEGRRHDAFLLAESPLLEQLGALPPCANGQRYCLYGDPAYPISEYIITPFRDNQNLTEPQATFNREMSKVRESVEYGFGKITVYFAFCDFKKNLKLHLMPVGKIYVVAALLTNCHTCLYRSVMNSLLDSDPPTLESYLS